MDSTTEYYLATRLLMKHRRTMRRRQRRYKRGMVRRVVVLRVEDYLTSELQRMVHDGIPAYAQPHFTMTQVQTELKGRLL